MGHAEGLCVEVVYCAGPDAADRVALQLPAGASVRDALQRSGLLQRHPGADGLVVGVWGKACAPDQPLRDGDRVELYRALRVEPMQARRLRASRQRGARKR